MCDKKESLNEKLAQKVIDLDEKIDILNDELKTWTDALEELSEIEDAFKKDGKFKLRGKTVLDVGTDCVKPLYIALKFKPSKIIGINEDLSVYSFEADLKQKSKLFAQTEIGLYSCSFFDKETFDGILKREKMPKKAFDFVLVSKTLHHLRTEKCVAKERDKNHNCREDEKCCIYGFNEEKIFKDLIRLGKRVIIYEGFYPQDEDDDKTRGRGGYLTAKEGRRILKHLSENYEVELIRPEQFPLNKQTFNRIEPILRKVDCVCFYVEEQHAKKQEKPKT